MKQKIMNKLRKVEWQTHDGEIKGGYIVIGNLVFFKGLWEGLFFSLSGLGITKAEKLLDLGGKDCNTVTFYCLKWGISLHRNGTSYKDALRNVVVTSDEPVSLKNLTFFS